MVPRSNIQLLSVDGSPPGSAGFKLTGSARDGSGLCRIWLRRKDPWSRYLDPRFRSDDWDVRCYRRTDSAFSLVEEFRVDTLDALADEFAFDGASELAALKPNGDVVHDTVLRWAKRTVGASPDSPGEVVTPVGAAPAQETKTVLPSRTAPAAETAPEPAVEPAPEPAALAPAVAEPPAPTPTPPHPVEPTPIEVPAVEGSDVLIPSALEMSDAWDEIADLAEKAMAELTGGLPAVPEDE